MSLAARSAQLRVMETLIGGGADPNLPDSGGNRWVPLHHAVHKRQDAAVTWLLDHGARPDGPDGVRLTPLMMAVASGQTDVARALLAHGADPHRRTPGGGSLLALAVSGGAFSDLDEPLLGACHPDTVLLMRSAAPDLALGGSWTDRTALAFARLNGCGESIRLAAAARN
jgi:ankyrin repeat protein